MEHRWMCGSWRAPEFQCNNNTTWSVTNTAALTRLISFSPVSKPRATATPGFSAWAATVSHSESHHENNVSYRPVVEHDMRAGSCACSYRFLRFLACSQLPSLPPCSPVSATVGNQPDHG